MRRPGRLQQILESGHFAVTAEIGPPRSADLTDFRRRAEMLRDYVDALNVTDNQRAVVRASSQACCGELARLGIEPVFQITCRDRNRIALQSDLLGAAALGAPNVLCLSGDHQSFGSEPGAKNVFDLDSVQLIETAAGMNRGFFAGGDRLEGYFQVYPGAAVNPFAGPPELPELPLLALRKKVKAGAQFIQTQCVYDVDAFAGFMARVREAGLDRQVKILAGVAPLKSARAARYMQEKVPGVYLPDELVKRLEAAGDQKEEGIRICVEIIERLKVIPGVAGVHIMAVAWEEVVPELVRRAGLYPRPGVERS